MIHHIIILLENFKLKFLSLSIIISNSPKSKFLCDIKHKIFLSLLHIFFSIIYNIQSLTSLMKFGSVLLKIMLSNKIKCLLIDE